MCGESSCPWGMPRQNGPGEMKCSSGYISERAHCDNRFFIPTEDVIQNKMTNLEKIFVLFFHIKASTFKMKDKFNRLEHGTSSVDLQA